MNIPSEITTIVAELTKRGSNLRSVKRGEVMKIATAHGYTWSQYARMFEDTRRIGHGLYDASDWTSASSSEPAAVAPTAAPAPATAPVMPPMRMTISSTVNSDIYIPEIDPCYIRWGDYDAVKTALESRQFFPIYIVGFSGNGKTVMIEQACARLRREYIRVQISPETDEDDLIGGFRLVNGETVFCKGPVVKAMERGCVLLVDELDRGSHKIMCMQGVLEGKPILIKKTGEVITPKEGFTVIATGNTKGRGSEDGRFAAATIMDDAFLERFIATIEQPFPPSNIESKIVLKHMESANKVDEVFAERLVAWANIIRKTFEAEGVDEVISTRRLCHIVKTYAIFNDRQKAIALCISRFDADTRAAFLDLYSKVDAPAPAAAAAPVAATPAPAATENAPF